MAIGSPPPRSPRGGRRTDTPGATAVYLVQARNDAMWAVRHCCVYLRFALSYHDVEELLAERGIAAGHVTVYRWVQRFTPLLVDAARPCRHLPGDRWFVDETYVKVAGRWTYLYRAVDQYGYGSQP